MANNSLMNKGVAVKNVRGIEKRVESIHIDGSPFKERCVIRVNEKEVLLTARSFKYFTILAFNLVRGDSGGWVYKDDIEPGDNHARYIYRMKTELTGALNGSSPLVENNRRGYYKLNVNPDAITFNRDNLRNYDDIGVSRLFI